MKLFVEAHSFFAIQAPLTLHRGANFYLFKKLWQTLCAQMSIDSNEINQIVMSRFHGDL